MKLITTLSVCLFAIGTSFAQTIPTPVKTKHAADKGDKTVIYGSLKDARNKPIKGAKAFVYKADSTIIASGFTDATGHYETNAVPAGTYFVKFVYATDKTALIYNIEVKKSVEVSYMSNPPVEDTMIAYDVLVPKVKLAPSGSKKK